MTENSTAERDHPFGWMWFQPVRGQTEPGRFYDDDRRLRRIIPFSVAGALPIVFIPVTGIPLSDPRVIVALAMIPGVIGLAHGLGLTATAEAVEREEQLRELQALHCDRGQGYYFARPQPPSSIGELLRSAHLGELIS